MQEKLLQISQYVIKHPIMTESEKYKKNYINLLDYFVRKYSPSDKYSRSVLELYKKRLLEQPKLYDYKDGKPEKTAKGTKKKKCKFFTYRYCLLVDTLFICAFFDEKKSEQIYLEILKMYDKRYWKNLEMLYKTVTGKSNNAVKISQIDYMTECIKVNRKFVDRRIKNILVTANMSAGKSTLLNSIIGKKLNKTQNDACTAKTHYLLNKAFEDTLTYEYDYELELDATLQILMDDNGGNTSNEIRVGTRFRSIENVDIPICFIDTPGVNSSQDRVHRDISEKDIVENQYDLLMYVLNGENIGTNDDRRHLEFVAKNYHGKIIFVINKLDRYRKDDSVPQTIKAVYKDLKGIGFKNPVICPVSAYAAYLAKMNMFQEELNDDEQDELERLYRKLSKDEYKFDTYYPEKYHIKDVSDNKNHQLLLHSGILSLEKMLYEER